MDSATTLPADLLAVLVERVERQLAGRGQVTDAKEIAQAISRTLATPGLTPEEERLVSEHGESWTRPRLLTDLLRLRVEGALAAGLACADPDATVARDKPSVLIAPTLGYAPEGASLVRTLDLQGGTLSHADAGTLILTDTEGMESLSFEGTLTFDAKTVPLSFPQKGSTVSLSEAAEVVELENGLEMMTKTLDEVVPPEAGQGTGEHKSGDLMNQVLGGKYRITRLLGRGGFGAVYEAVDQELGSRVAVKVLNKRASQSEADVNAFRDEARRVTRLSHPNVIDWKVLDRMEDGTLYFVMEFLEGEELSSLLKREKVLAPRRAQNILLQVLEALRAAHHLSATESVVHLDLKPDNAFLVSSESMDWAEERVKVIDFGIGQYVGGSEKTAENVTRCGACTPEYASPEQCAHMTESSGIVELDGRSDLYSLGVVAFQMLTGELPFPKPEVRREWLKLHQTAAPRRVRDVNPKVPRALAAFVDRCLVKERDQRWTDTHEAHAALHRIVHPPAWKLAVKVAVPVVVAAGIAVFFLKGKDATARFSVTQERGGRTLPLDGQTPLFLGWQNPERMLAVAELEGDLTGATLRLLEAGEDPEGVGSTFADWTVVPAGSSRIRVSAPGTLATLPLTTVYVDAATKIGRQLSADFPLRFVGGDDWNATSLSIVDFIEGPLDPEGCELVLEVDDEDGLIESVLPLADGDLVAAGKARAWSTLRASGGKRRVRLDELWQLENDAAGRLSLELTDVAGNTKVVAGPEVEIVLDELAWMTPPALAGASEKDRKLQVSKTSEIHLSASANRRAELTVSVENIYGDPLEGMQVPEPAANVLDSVPLVFPDSDSDYEGKIVVRASDAGFVHHADGPDELVERLAFQYVAAAPEITAFPPGLALVGDAYYTRRPDQRVTVNRNAVDVHIDVDVRPLGGDEWMDVDAKDMDQPSFVTYDKAQLALGEDGAYEVRVRGFRLVGGTASRADEDTVESAFVLHLDRTGGAIELSGLDPGLVLGAGVPFADFDTLSLRAEVADAVDRLEYRLRPPSGTPVSGSFELAGGEGELALASLWRGALSLPEDRPDGDYVLEVSGRDRAGNDLTPASFSWEVAQAGPTFKVHRPVSAREWIMDPKDFHWEVLVEASDANDVAWVRCRVFDPDEDSRSTALDLERQAGTDRWSARYLFKPDWGGRNVDLELFAEDVQGVASHDFARGYELEPIEPPRPDCIATSIGGRSTGRMRLVRSNEANFMFRGRSDAVENETYREYPGLKDLGFQDATSSLGKSLGIVIRAGDIGSFYLDVNEVTVGQYLEFVRAADGYAAATYWPPPEAPETDDPMWSPAPVTRDPELLKGELEALNPALPVSVNWSEAQAYASWAGKRLPSFVEWEWSVRGGTYRPFAAAGSAAYQDLVRAGAMPVDGVWPDTSSEGIHGLCSNLSEWTASRALEGMGANLFKDPSEYGRLRAPHSGQDWDRSRHYWLVGPNFRIPRFDFYEAPGPRPRDYRAPIAGFRCALSLEDAVEALDTDGTRLQAREAPCR